MKRDNEKEKKKLQRENDGRVAWKRIQVYTQSKSTWLIWIG